MEHKNVFFFLDPIDFHCMDKLNCAKLFFKISFVFRRNKIVFRVWNIIRVNYTFNPI